MEIFISRTCVDDKGEIFHSYARMDGCMPGRRSILLHPSGQQSFSPLLLHAIHSIS
jgi:hypothetical protein